MLKLSSGIERDQKGHFLLDEDGIRRISGILNSKAQSLQQTTTLVYFVRREDDRFYETTELDDLLADPNTYKHRIQHLVIELRKTDPAHTIAPWDRKWVASISFTFEKEGRVKFTIASDDKNWSLLLADELEPQISRTRVNQKVSTFLLLSFYAALACFFYAGFPKIGALIGFSPEVVKNIIFFALVGIAIATLGSIGERNEIIASIFGPESCFCWGEQSRVLERRVEFHKNITWAIIVGFFISLASTVYTSATLPALPSEAVIKK
ncbi:MAG TPA: hypothetical protein VFW84_05490 [Aquabacterium sp.]|uniref:hypothetical protein n=1 Tax=Aquabacterium sp. TaxID=1872578 RepID=UPI002E338D10|nr:hypothetical protein [Aquabacterium sp.]HEX5372167.1 hypothetical protein [Aquabacterium sp.]